MKLCAACTAPFNPRQGRPGLHDTYCPRCLTDLYRQVPNTAKIEREVVDPSARIDIDSVPTSRGKTVAYQQKMPLDGKDANGVPYYRQSRGNLAVSLGFCGAIGGLLATCQPMPLAVGIFLVVLLIYFIGVTVQRSKP